MTTDLTTNTDDKFMPEKIYRKMHDTYIIY